MKLINMKLPKRTKTELNSAPVSYAEQERWPYGLRVRLEKEQIKVLPYAAKVAVGDKVFLYAECTVIAVRMSERQDKEIDHNVELQLEAINLEPKLKKAIKDMTPQEYKEFRLSNK